MTLNCVRSSSEFEWWAAPRLPPRVCHESHITRASRCHGHAFRRALTAESEPEPPPHTQAGSTSQSTFTPATAVGSQDLMLGVYVARTGVMMEGEFSFSLHISDLDLELDKLQGRAGSAVRVHDILEHGQHKCSHLKAYRITSRPQAREFLSTQTDASPTHPNKGSHHGGRCGKSHLIQALLCVVIMLSGLSHSLKWAKLTCSGITYSEVSELH